MKKRICCGLIVILLAACASLNSAPDPTWYDILPDENACIIAYQTWANIPPAGPTPIESGFILRTEEGTTQPTISTYGEHSCPSAVSFFTKTWEKQETKRFNEAKYQSGASFRWRQNLDMKCICDQDTIDNAKKELEYKLNHAKGETDDQK